MTHFSALLLLNSVSLAAPDAPQHSSSFALCPAAENARFQVNSDGVLFPPFLFKDGLAEVPDEATVALERVLLGLKNAGVQVVIVPLPLRTIFPDQGVPVPENVDFDRAEAVRNYRDFIAKIGRHAVVINILEVEEQLSSGASFHRRLDHHWSQDGVDLTAAAVAAVIAEQSVYEGHSRQSFVTRVTNEPLPDGEWVAKVHSLCPDVVVPPNSHFIRETKLKGAKALGLFDEVAPPPVVLVGTSMSTTRYAFAGALKASTGLDVLRYDLAGGGNLTPLMSYLRTDDYRTHPPEVLVWEFPTRAVNWGAPEDVVSFKTPDMYRQLVPSVYGGCAEEGARWHGATKIRPKQLAALDVTGDGWSFTPDSHYLQLHFSDPTVHDFRVNAVYADDSRDSYHFRPARRLQRNGWFYLEFPEHAGSPITGLEIDLKQGSGLDLWVCERPPQ